MNDDEQSDIRNKKLGFIFLQQYNLIPKLTVLENVEVPLMYGGVSKSHRRQRAMEALDKVGLASKYKNLPLSSPAAQQRRVSIAKEPWWKPFSHPG